MSEKKEVVELMKDFEEKFGFKTYEAIKYCWALIYIKMEELEKSRDNWRKKYEQIHLLEKERKKKTSSC